MSDAKRSIETTCPDCGALVGAGVKKCWLCGAALAELKDVGQKIRSFGATVENVISIGVSSVIAFFATFFAGGFATLFGLGAAKKAGWLRIGYEAFDWAIGTGVVLGIIAAGYVGYRQTRRFWPRKD